MEHFIEKRISYPKINARLSVVGKNEQNYHELETLFLLLNAPCDTITLAIDHDDSFRYRVTSNANIPLNEHNLCVKALFEYFKAENVGGHFHIDIQKYIPIAGGMGGGSSNAATLLSILNKKWKLYSAQQLHVLATRLGADVPLFLYENSAVGRGIGEDLTPINMHHAPQWGIVLVSSFFPVPAAWAYQHREGAFSEKGEVNKILNAYYQQDINTFCACIKNDLAPAVIAKFPLLQNHIKKLYDLGALKVELSGSGPTLFAVFESFDFAQDAVKRFNAMSDDLSIAIASGFLTH